MHVLLPKPPSVNHLYGYTSIGGFARSYVTAEGKKWFTVALDIIHSSRATTAPLDTKLGLMAKLYTVRAQDIDNILKCTFDVLQKCHECQKARCTHNKRVIKNDSLIYRAFVFKEDVSLVSAEGLEVTLFPLDELDGKSPLSLEQPPQDPVFPVIA